MKSPDYRTLQQRFAVTSLMK